MLSCKGLFSSLRKKRAILCQNCCSMQKYPLQVKHINKTDPCALFFTENCYCIAWIKCCWQCTKPQPFIFYPKLSDLVLLVMPNACDTPIQRYLRFVQGAAFAMRERNKTPFFYAQMKTRNCSPQAEWANWPQPTGRNQISYGQLEAVNSLVKLPSVGCVQLSLTRLKPLKHNSNTLFRYFERVRQGSGNESTRLDILSQYSVFDL